MSWETTAVPFAVYRIQARATDAFGNSSLIDSNAEHFVWGDNYAPDVMFTVPRNGTRVSAKSTVTAHFGDTIDKDSLKATDATTGKPTVFTLRKKGTRTLVAATVAFDPGTGAATLALARKLKSGATYIATVTPAATDQAGNVLDQNSFAADNQPMTWKFPVK